MIVQSNSLKSMADVCSYHQDNLCSHNHYCGCNSAMITLSTWHEECLPHGYLHKKIYMKHFLSFLTLCSMLATFVRPYIISKRHPAPGLINSLRLSLQPDRVIFVRTTPLGRTNLLYVDDYYWGCSFFNCLSLTSSAMIWVKNPCHFCYFFRP